MALIRLKFAVGKLPGDHESALWAIAECGRRRRRALGRKEGEGGERELEREGGVGFCVLDTLCRHHSSLSVCVFTCLLLLSPSSPPLSLSLCLGWGCR